MMYDSKIANENQFEYVNDHQVPMFAPPGGKCYSCGKDIYEPKVEKEGDTTYISGYSVGLARSEHITGCPHCNKSFCD